MLTALAHAGHTAQAHDHGTGALVIIGLVIALAVSYVSSRYLTPGGGSR